MNRLKILRTEKGETLEKIAEYLNVTIQTISNYENEKRDMSPDIILKLSEYFGVSTDYLLGKSDVKNPSTLNLTKDDIKFIKSIKKLDETNKMIIKNTIEALFDKQEENKN